VVRHYLKSILRNIWKNKLYTIINVVGLSIGLASFIIILLYLNYELSYDKWDERLNNVHRLSVQTEGVNNNMAPAPLAPYLQEKDPAVVSTTRIMFFGNNEVLLGADEKKIYQKGFAGTDPNFLKVFPFKLVAGDPATALENPGSAVITEDVAKKLFGTTDAMGKTIMVFNSLQFQVTGIMKLPATPSHMQIEVLTHDDFIKETNSDWENYSYTSYVLVNEHVDRKQLEERFNTLYHTRPDTEGQTQKKVIVEPVPGIHNFPRQGESNFRTTFVLFLLAILLLVSGAINFSNLSVAKSMRRAREVGVRKALGSSRGQVFFLFLMEIILQCVFSLLLAIGLVVLVFPYFNTAYNLNLSIWNQKLLNILGQLGITLIIVSLLSGLYPAFTLSRLKETAVLKTGFSRRANTFFSNSLVVVQFVVSAFFICSIMVINMQMRFMRNKDTGFNAEQVIRIEASQKTREKEFSRARDILLQTPGVQYVSKSTTIPGSAVIDTSTRKFRYHGKEFGFASVKVSTDYFRALDIKLMEGRLFGEDHPEDNDNTAIINESAAKMLDDKNVIGATILFPNCDSIPYRIVGIVKDFNVKGFESVVQPTLYSISNAHCGFKAGGAFLVKINTNDVQQLLRNLTEKWKLIEPDFPIRYSFLDQNFEQLFREYARVQDIILSFAMISIFIAILGLIALSAFIAEQRAKEISIRKTLGASMSNITRLLTRDVVGLVLTGIVIAVPLAWWFIYNWLQNFAYHIRVSWWMFALAGAIVFIIAVATVSFQALKAAAVKPSRNLKSE
jgi:putative ABC transport system permease protein